MFARTALLLVCVFAPSPAAAQTAVEKARTAYDEGRAAFAGGDFLTALERFERAYLLDNAPALIFNMARAAEEAGLAEKAVTYYELYLDRNPTGSDRAEVERRVRVARAMLERERRRATPASATAGSDSLRPALGWGLLGVGVAGAVVGTLFITAALGDAETAGGLRPVDADRHRALSDDVESQETVAWLGFGVGVLALAGGAALLWPSSGDAQASLGVPPRGAGIRVRW